MFGWRNGLKFFYNYIRMHHTKLNINLTGQQKQIFSMLMTYRQQLQLKTVMRVAGGWVRDKILGKQSNDIDITLDDMKGQAFVKLIKQHAQSKNQKISGFGVTKFNPQLSKHLQTATVKIFNHSIDFVNLRSEKYSQTSRIPIIDVGTPKQDAQRRDFTINSLFYNLLTEEIEDWTTKGIQDLQKGVIRTPLQPWITFKDDPLRIMRCFRFAGRFNFKIIPQILQAVKSKEIREALKSKVSKQRIGLQLLGIFAAKNPLLALQHILNNHIWNIVFQIPSQTDLKEQQFYEQIPNYSFNCLNYYLESILKNKLLTQKQLYQSEEQTLEMKNKKKKKNYYSQQQLKAMTCLSCLLVVYRKYKKTGPKPQSLVEYLVKNQLKFSLKISKFCLNICDSIQYFCKISDLKDINTIVKWLQISQQKWQIVLHIMQALNKVEKKVRGFQPLQLRQFIFSNKLENVYLVQSYIEGNFLIKRGKKGPIIKIILDNSLTWRVLNPNKSKEQFLTFFQENYQLFQDNNMYSKPQ